MKALSRDAQAVIELRHHDPFQYLGRHLADERWIVRVFLPDAEEVKVVQPKGKATTLTRMHEAGLFEGTLPNGSQQYRVLARYGDRHVEMEDPYRFPPVLSDFDLFLLGEGSHLQLYEKLGAHPIVHEGVAGVAFVVFVPGARRVSVVGDFNGWDGRLHAMRVRGQGYWEIFVPGAAEGSHYKYEIVGRNGRLLPLKSDPVAFSSEVRPRTASVVFDLKKLNLVERSPSDINALSSPMSIYEVHLGSWRRKDDGRWLTYRELSEQLPAYVRDMGFTHVEFMPVSEHPFDGSWGYQPTGLFAPTSRYGTPADFAVLVDACHHAGLGVLIDWVPGHFPDDPHGLAQFDGEAVYEHHDPRQGRHRDWNTLIYNYGRTEVSNFLRANALFWLERYRIDGIRVDAVASMLYLDYSREAGNWVPNKYGGRENLEAVEFLRRTNTEIFSRYPNATTAAEESTDWPMVSRPVDCGGLGFGYKWNMGWMHDTLNYVAKDPVYRKHHHGDVLFGLHYAFSENFILPLSHDEVVHGKRSILGRMPGDDWQRFANMREYLAFMFGHPGKKLLFMGSEFAQEGEWNHDGSLDWNLLGRERNAGVQRLVRDLNLVYRQTPALHELDSDPAGFEWLEMNDAERSVFVWLRKGKNTKGRCVVAVNFTPEVYRDYRIKVPFAGTWREILNSDAEIYGGSNVGNGGAVKTLPKSSTPEMSLVLPPLAAVFLVPE
jgi:1,4-alpha-glucan branching enzyme